MNEVLAGYGYFLAGLRVALFWIAVVVAVIALVDWAVRTRRLNPFGPIGRFSRRFVDPLMVPVERRVVRAGGQPSSAPWWTLVFVVVGGLLFIWILELLSGVIADLMVGMQSPEGVLRLLLAWAFRVLRIALIVRVISTWFQISPYSKWIRWSYWLTEWLLAPLRRVVPPLGAVDVTPLVAFFVLWMLQRIVGV